MYYIIYVNIDLKMEINSVSKKLLKSEGRNRKIFIPHPTTAHFLDVVKPSYKSVEKGGLIYFFHLF